MIATYSGSMVRAANVVLLLASALLVGVPAAGADDPVDYSTEHLPESAMSARFGSLPWADGPLAAGRWQELLAVGFLDIGSDFLTARGPRVGLGATRAWNDRWGLALLGFYDSQGVSGGTGERRIRGNFSDAIPLDLPARAELSAPHGSVRHLGVGAGAVRQWRRPGDPRRRTTLLVGALADRLELDGYRMEYRLIEGTDAGVAGELDFSGGYDTIAPFLSVDRTRPLGQAFDLHLRLTAVLPFPKQGFDARITGPDFDVVGDSDAASGDAPIPDGGGGLGVVFEHRPSGLSIDLGSTLFFAAAEGTIHSGIDRSLTLEVAWRPRARRTEPGG